MRSGFASLSTGLPGLDRMLEGVRPGDSFVWQVDRIRDYEPFVPPLLRAAREGGRKLIYFRFAHHAPLLSEDSGAVVHEVRTDAGFEKFLTRMLEILKEESGSAVYVFDCLSDLAHDWYSDRMLANFFMIVSPFTLEFNTLAYFALLRNYHSWHAMEGIHESARVMLEVYRKDERLYIHPIKVFRRHTPTMYALHAWEGDEFRPVTSSATLSEILAEGGGPWIDFTMHRFGFWTRTFMDAQETLKAIRNGKESPEVGEACKQRLLRMALTRDERFLALADRYFDLADVVAIMKRMIGTGLIGGKSLGMLLARAILRRAGGACVERLEVHDSFFVGSDVFYTYLVKNKAWRLKFKGEPLDSIIARAEEARQKVLRGTFPKYIEDQFAEMLAYFGQSPIIVRSSSLLEDNFGNAFAGKYESVFCANQGRPAERLEDFINAARTVYASTMSREAILYRLHHGLYDREEQMALLVQRVSGEMHGNLYYPHVAGVGFSFNPYVWSQQIDPRAGVLRVVFGLGTRAVNRTEDDYTRLVALNAPKRRPQTDFGKVRQYSQKRADVLDLKRNRLATSDWEEVARDLPRPIFEKLAGCDEELLRRMPELDRRDMSLWTLTFDNILSESTFVDDMRGMLQTLERAYGSPVDIEFTANLTGDGNCRINLLQCRPFQARTKRIGARIEFPRRVQPGRVVFDSHGPIIGQSRELEIHRVIYVTPSEYGRLPHADRYAIARVVGQILHLPTASDRKNIMLLGPGRWGTSMPHLGLPVTFAEISPAAVLCEIALMHEGLIPDVSLGTHFLNDLVELDILCLGVFPGREADVLNERFFTTSRNRLTELLPDAAKWENVIRVVDTDADGPPGGILLQADSFRQRALCHLRD